ncbi:MAG: hypothetical protein D6725_14455 [Planctomycetota bacterium]|nr:MAG: hypothetical protein D6725_14455 [Planctomycetota bacterium]
MKLGVAHCTAAISIAADESHGVSAGEHPARGPRSNARFNRAAVREAEQRRGSAQTRPLIAQRRVVATCLITLGGLL